MTAPDAPTLPDILAVTRATGWLAEGLARLYAVEEVSRRHSGLFTYLEVGPSTASAVRMNGQYEVQLPSSAARIGKKKKVILS